MGTGLPGPRRTDIAVTSGPASVSPNEPLGVQELLGSLLRSHTATSDERWRRWCEYLVVGERLTPDALHGWWRAAVEFDAVLAESVANLVPVPPETVLVAGSGKEVFKTFNVSTAAAVLAAAAGTPVVKGVSRSVSAVSGAADVLDVLGVGPVRQSTQISQALDRWGIAFVAYPIFCPQYAARYDGVFSTINPASFFMPVAALCVQASGFVLGLAHPDVILSTRALRLIRPDLAGVVVATDLGSGELVDEYCDVGTVTVAHGVQTATRAGAQASDRWRNAVAHQATHEQNAAMVVASITAGADTPCARLVEQNAALIVAATAPDSDLSEALDRVRRARQSGHATRLLRNLTHD